MSVTNKSNKKPLINYTKYKQGYPDAIYILDCEREKLPRKTKLRVMYYLANCIFQKGAVIGAHLVSPFTNEEINAYGSYLMDDEYKWQDDLWIYVRDQDLKLPAEFIEKVNKFFDDGNNTALSIGAREDPVDGRPYAFWFAD